MASSWPLTDAAFLTRLGQRVRQIRAQRGMSRRLLAESADVSERYLAQLEAGKGNVSILLLRQIAAAMGTRIDALVDLAEDLPAEYEVIRERLRQCDGETLSKIYEQLFTPDAQLAHRRRIAFVGLRGAGKSTVGRAVASRLSLPFKELADEIESIAGMALGEIFSLGGQSSYRNFERQAVTSLLGQSEDCVIAVGGSVVSETTTYENLLASCTTIWLTATPEDHMNRVIAQGDNRPMAGNRRAMAELKRILLERESLYRRADYIVDTHGKTAPQTVEEVLALPDIQKLNTPLTVDA